MSNQSAIDNQFRASIAVLHANMLDALEKSLPLFQEIRPHDYEQWKQEITEDCRILTDPHVTYKRGSAALERLGLKCGEVMRMLYSDDM